MSGKSKSESQNTVLKQHTVSPLARLRERVRERAKALPLITNPRPSRRGLRGNGQSLEPPRPAVPVLPLRAVRNGTQLDCISTQAGYFTGPQAGAKPC